MKYLVVSDIHGNPYYTNKLQELIREEECDKLILLGDLFSFQTDTVKELNKLKDFVLAVKGNCDFDFFLTNLEFPLEKFQLLNIGDKNFFFTHGHTFSPYNVPIGIDVFVYGHTHIYEIKEETEIIICNPGSISQPRDNTPHTYMTIDEEYITIKDEDGKILALKDYH